MNRTEIADALEKIRKRIQRAADKAGRNPEEIRIVGVGKTVPVHRIEAAIEAGILIIGENYIKEVREKFEHLSRLPVSLHFIGHLQSNKSKYAVRMFDLIHSVDSLKLAEELNREAEKIAKIQDILIQVNVAEEKTKSGVRVEETLSLARSIGSLPHVRVRGLMAMPPFFDLPEKARPYFKIVRDLSRAASEAIPGVLMEELSMGMSGDFEAAVEEGATLVRIGTALFGGRS